MHENGGHTHTQSFLREEGRSSESHALAPCVVCQFLLSDPCFFHRLRFILVRPKHLGSIAGPWRRVSSATSRQRARTTLTRTWTRLWGLVYYQVDIGKLASCCAHFNKRSTSFSCHWPAAKWMRSAAEILVTTVLVVSYTFAKEYGSLHLDMDRNRFGDSEWV